MKKRWRMFFYTFFSPILFDSIFSTGLSGVHRICLSDLQSWRKYEYKGEFTAYANDSGVSEPECAQKCIERLEECTATKFEPTKKLCLFSKQQHKCEELTERIDSKPISQLHILHCISCRGVLPGRNGSIPAYNVSDMVFQAGAPTKQLVQRFTQSVETKPIIRKIESNPRNQPIYVKPASSTHSDIQDISLLLPLNASKNKNKSIHRPKTRAFQLQKQRKLEILPSKQPRPYPGIFKGNQKFRIIRQVRVSGLFVPRTGEEDRSSSHIPRAQVVSNDSGRPKPTPVVLFPKPTGKKTRQALKRPVQDEAINLELEDKIFKTGQPLFPSDIEDFQVPETERKQVVKDPLEIAQDELYPDIEEAIGQSSQFPEPTPLEEPPVATSSAAPPHFTTPKPLFVTWRPHSFLFTSDPGNVPSSPKPVAVKSPKWNGIQDRFSEGRGNLPSGTRVQPTVFRSKSYPEESKSNASIASKSNTASSASVTRRDKELKNGSNFKLFPHRFPSINPFAQNKQLFPSKPNRVSSRTSEQSAGVSNNKSLFPPRIAGRIGVDPRGFGNQFRPISRQTVTRRRPIASSALRPIGNQEPPLLTPAPSLKNFRDLVSTKPPPGQPRFLWTRKPIFNPTGKLTTQPRTIDRAPLPSNAVLFPASKGARRPIPRRTAQPPKWSTRRGTDTGFSPVPKQTLNPPPQSRSINGAQRSHHQTDSWLFSGRNGTRKSLGKPAIGNRPGLIRFSSPNSRLPFQRLPQQPSGNGQIFPSILSPIHPDLRTLFHQTENQQHDKIPSEFEKAKIHFGVNLRRKPTAPTQEKPTATFGLGPNSQRFTSFGESARLPEFSRGQPLNSLQIEDPGVTAGEDALDSQWEKVKNVPLFPSANPTVVPTQSGLPQLLGMAPWDKALPSGLIPQSTPRPFAHLQAADPTNPKHVASRSESQIHPPLDLETFLALQPTFALPWWRPTTPPTLIILPDTQKTKSSAQATLPPEKIKNKGTTTLAPRNSSHSIQTSKLDRAGGKIVAEKKILSSESKVSGPGILNNSSRKKNGDVPVINIALAHPKIQISGVGNFFPDRSNIELTGQLPGLPEFDISLVPTDSNDESSSSFKVVSFSRDSAKTPNNIPGRLGRKGRRNNATRRKQQSRSQKQNHFDVTRLKNETLRIETNLTSAEKSIENTFREFEPTLHIPHDWELLRSKARQWEKEARRAEVSRIIKEEKSASAFEDVVLSSPKDSHETIDESHEVIPEESNKSSMKKSDLESDGLELEDTKFIRIIYGPRSGEKTGSMQNSDSVERSTSNESRLSDRNLMPDPILNNLMKMNEEKQTESPRGPVNDLNELEDLHTKNIRRDSRNNFSRRKSDFTKITSGRRQTKNQIFTFQLGKQKGSYSPKYWMEQKMKALSARVPTGSNAHLMNESCTMNNLNPCIFGFGQGCSLQLDINGCRICTCPDRTPAKGCSGPQGLTEKMRKDYLLQRRRCPDGRRAQMVHRFQREKFGGCIIRKQPYCGWLMDVQWRMPRTRKECREYCYSDVAHRAGAMRP